MTEAKVDRKLPRVALRRAEAAEALGVSIDFFEKHVQPEIKVIRRGRLRLFPYRELERWAAENAAFVGLGGASR